MLPKKRQNALNTQGKRGNLVSSHLSYNRTWQVVENVLRNHSGVMAGAKQQANGFKEQRHFAFKLFFVAKLSVPSRPPSPSWVGVGVL